MNRQIEIKHEKITTEKLNRYNAVLLSKDFMKRFDSRGVSAIVLAFPLSNEPLTESLALMEEFCYEIDCSYAAIALNKYGQDDRLALVQWAKSQRMPRRVDVYIGDEYDCANLECVEAECMSEFV